MEQGAKFTSWYITNDAGGLCVRRERHNEDGTVQNLRLPRVEYAKYAANRDALQAFVDRLNGRDRRAELARRAARYRQAFIHPRLVEDFQDKIKNAVPNRKDAAYLITCLHEYVLNFFLAKVKLVDPQEWKAQEHRWGAALLNVEDVPEAERLFEPGVTRAGKSIRTIVQVANRFLAFLHERYPKEYALVRLEPVSAARFTEHEAWRKLSATEPTGRFITPVDWEKIRAALTPDLMAPAVLSYCYGLRRGEGLGLQVGDVRRGHLAVARQLKRAGDEGFAPLKDRDARSTPHWFCTAADAYELISKIQRLNPDTYGVRWAALMLSLGFKYELHDLRRTFITRALRIPGLVPRDVQLAVGHSNIETTMRYAQDDRESSDDVYEPAS